MSASRSLHPATQWMGSSLAARRWQTWQGLDRLAERHDQRQRGFSIRVARVLSVLSPRHSEHLPQGSEDTSQSDGWSGHLDCSSDTSDMYGCPTGVASPTTVVSVTTPLSPPPLSPLPTEVSPSSASTPSRSAPLGNARRRTSKTSGIGTPSHAVCPERQRVSASLNVRSANWTASAL